MLNFNRPLFFCKKERNRSTFSAKIDRRTASIRLCPPLQSCTKGEAHVGAGLCRLAQGLRLRASTDPMPSTGGAHGASVRPKPARAVQRAQRLDEDAVAAATLGVRDGTQPKKSRSRDGGMGAALVSTDHVARSEPLWPSLCVCVARYAAGHVQKCMLREL